MDMLLAVLVVATPVVSWLSWKAWRRSRRRREGEALGALATRRGWGFTPEDDVLLAEFQGVPVSLDDRRGWNFVRGESAGHEFVAFDLELIQVVRSRGFEMRIPRDRTVVAVRLPHWSPAFLVVPENALGRSLLAAFGMDIELELEEFNRTFSVVGDDRRFVVNVLTPETMQHLLARPTLKWNCHGRWLALVLPGRLLPMVDILEDEVAWAAEVVQRIPPFAWEPTTAD